MDRKTGLVIKQAIDSVYTGGVDVLLSYKTDEKGNITGFFRDRGQNYSYTITPKNKITYVEAEVNRQDAAYLEGLVLTGYAFLSGKTSVYTQSALNTNLSRFDSSKPDVCQKGKPCGGACISKNAVCQQRLGLKESSLLNKLKKSKALKIGAGVIAGLAVAATGKALVDKVNAKKQEQTIRNKKTQQNVRENRNTEEIRNAKQKTEAETNHQAEITKEILRITKEMDDPNLTSEQMEKLAEDLKKLAEKESGNKPGALRKFEKQLKKFMNGEDVNLEF